jgi:hypothetical protein
VRLVSTDISTLSREMETRLRKCLHTLMTAAGAKIDGGDDGSILDISAKQFTRRKMLDRLDLGRSDREKQDLRFCKCHPVEEKRFSIKYTIRNEEGKTTEVFSQTKVVKGLPQSEKRQVCMLTKRSCYRQK